ncbi:hypothetical protein ACNKHM_18645 [Shigella sonnei]
MPCHTHEPDGSLFYSIWMMTPAFSTSRAIARNRHIVMHNEQAVISRAGRSISGVGTKAYTFIWGMVGENHVFDDMDHVAVKDLR